MSANGKTNAGAPPKAPVAVATAASGAAKGVSDDATTARLSMPENNGKKVTKPTVATQQNAGDDFKATLTVKDMVVWGLITMVPISPMAVYGGVFADSGGMPTLAFLIGFVAVLFSVFSFGIMIQHFPSSGSIFTYVSHVFGKLPGFIAGWLMLFAETNQEAYDNYLQAMRIAEAVSLPIMVCQDGFITSHAIENIELVETEKVKEFVGEYKPAHALLKPGEPMAVGAYATPVYYMEAKRQQAQAMLDAKDVIRKVGKEFGEMTGRTYGLIETYMMDDAEEAIVIIGSSAGTAKEAINELRAQGKKVGQIKVRSFRPFPSEDICEALKNVKAFAVMDKDDSFNAHCGPMFAEVTASLYAAGISGPKGINYIYGLGGRDVRVESIQHVFAELEKIAATGEVGETYRYLDVRE